MDNFKIRVLGTFNVLNSVFFCYFGLLFSIFYPKGLFFMDMGLSKEGLEVLLKCLFCLFYQIFIVYFLFSIHFLLFSTDIGPPKEGFWVHLNVNFHPLFCVFLLFKLFLG